MEVRGEGRHHQSYRTYQPRFDVGHEVAVDEGVVEERTTADTDGDGQHELLTHGAADIGAEVDSPTGHVSLLHDDQILIGGDRLLWCSVRPVCGHPVEEGACHPSHPPPC